MTALGSTDSSSTIGARIAIDTLDHLVLTVHDPDATARFYVGVLGMREETVHGATDDGRVGLHFGDQKLNLHVAGSEPSPHASSATPGSADLCFITRTPVEGVLRVFEEHRIAVEHGPVERMGATGPLLSVYVRDPDGNLVELANRLGD